MMEKDEIKDLDFFDKKREGFTGSSGQDVDTLFAGPFHPDFGNIGELLLGQLEWRKLIAAWNDGITPEYDVWMKLIGSIHLQKQKESNTERYN